MYFFVKILLQLQKNVSTNLQISFAISHEIVPGRMALLITLMLCLINIFNTITSDSPYTKSFTSISIWMVACITLVTSALLQYGIILLFWKYTLYEQKNIQIIIKKIDLVCLTIEILAFAVFNIIFWTTTQKYKTRYVDLYFYVKTNYALNLQITNYIYIVNCLT